MSGMYVTSLTSQWMHIFIKHQVDDALTNELANFALFGKTFSLYFVSTVYSGVILSSFLSESIILR